MTYMSDHFAISKAADVSSLLITAGFDELLNIVPPNSVALKEW